MTFPASMRVPGARAQVSATSTRASSGEKRALIFGQKLPTGSATANTLVQCSSAAQAQELFGQGSMLHRMLKAFFANSTGVVPYVMPVADAAGTRAVGSIAVSGTATENGTISLYVGGQLVEVSVSSTDTAAEIASAIVAALSTYGDELASGHLTVGTFYVITARDAVDFTADGAANNNVGTVFQATSATVTLTSVNKVKPVTNNLALVAGVDTGDTATVDLQAKHLGTLGNYIDVRVNYLGAVAGESLPAGVTLTITEPTDGATDPTLTSAIAALGDTSFFVIANPWASTTPLDAIKTEIEDRWDYDRQVYGRQVSAYSGTYASAYTFFAGRNFAHEGILAVKNSPTTYEELTAALAGVCITVWSSDPAQTLVGQELVGCLPPDASDRYTYAERAALLAVGGATYLAGSSNEMLIERLSCTYREDSLGNPDSGWVDLRDSSIDQEVTERLVTGLGVYTQGYKLASDTTPVSQGQRTVTPSLLKLEVLAILKQLEEDGIIQNVDALKSDITASIHTGDLNRCDVSCAVQRIGGMYVLPISINFQV